MKNWKGTQNNEANHSYLLDLENVLQFSLSYIRTMLQFDMFRCQCSFWITGSDSTCLYKTNSNPTHAMKVHHFSCTYNPIKTATHSFTMIMQVFELVRPYLPLNRDKWKKEGNIHLDLLWQRRGYWNHPAILSCNKLFDVCPFIILRRIFIHSLQELWKRHILG